MTNPLYPNTPAGWAAQARDCLKLALVQLAHGGYEQVRVDQWERPDTKEMVETGYAYGETRLTYHGWKGDRSEVTDYRITGPSGAKKCQAFRRTAGV